MTSFAPALLVARLQLSQSALTPVHARRTEDRRAIVADLPRALDGSDAFSEVGRAKAEHLEALLAAGAHDHLTALPELVHLLRRGEVHLRPESHGARHDRRRVDRRRHASAVHASRRGLR